MENKTKQLTTLAMLAAIALVVTLFIRISFMPGAPFLVYDPKDVVIVVAGLMFGPLAAFILAIVVAFVEMITVSHSGIIGMLMGAMASITFACPAAFLYKHSNTLKSAVVGLVLGMLAATGTMILWNYLIIPLYTGMPREAVVGMLVPIILPFNLIKTGLNASIAMLVYKPITKALKTAKLYAPSRQNAAPNKGFNIAVVLVSAFVLLSLILLAVTL